MGHCLYEITQQSTAQIECYQFIYAVALRAEMI
ncbi:hypothetical protein D2E26_1371 [Bifidobacterium dolichotidis]|uniref:Uncharacterized protein n=1 Tax=Bifidobacterium dolichotidis TaxID=2306976 RepID=A0A430FP18_9BIFI|nr:hypothetical protein D2E26_1371 [Bifidobacterium dolichotidis]